MRRPFRFVRCTIAPSDQSGMSMNKVAGRKRWYEEATHTAPEPAEPHGTQEMRRT